MPKEPITVARYLDGPIYNPYNIFAVQVYIIIFDCRLSSGGAVILLANCSCPCGRAAACWVLRSAWFHTRALTRCGPSPRGFLETERELERETQIRRELEKETQRETQSLERTVIQRELERVTHSEQLKRWGLKGSQKRSRIEIVHMYTY